MNRQQYLTYRSTNQLGNIVYEYYKQTCFEKNIVPLQPGDMIPRFNIWPGNDQAVEKVLAHYDEVFDIFTLINSQGVPIKFY